MTLNAGTAKPNRRRHTPELKAQLVAACLQPGASIAAIALAHQLNANQLHKWIKAQRSQQPNVSGLASPPSALVPVTLQPIKTAQSEDIQIEIRRAHANIHITWPISQAAACAQWLREILR